MIMPVSSLVGLTGFYTWHKGKLNLIWHMTHKFILRTSDLYYFLKNINYYSLCVFSMIQLKNTESGVIINTGDNYGYR